MPLGIPQSALPLLAESDYPGFQRLIPENDCSKNQCWMGLKGTVPESESGSAAGPAPALATVASSEMV